MSNARQYSEMAKHWSWWKCILLPVRAAEAIKVGASIIDDLLEERNKTEAKP